MSRVLVTGGSGFIGRQCIPLLLARGHEVHAVSSRPGCGGVPGVVWHEADLLDGGQARRVLASVRPRKLLHLAWYAVPGRYEQSLENYRWVAATVELMREFGEAGGERFVGAGTCFEYEWGGATCVEGVTPLVPATPYGLCKRVAAELADAFAAQTPLSAAWGRIFFLYGPGERPQRFVASIITALLRGEPARCSHGRQVRDFLHVRDVAGAFAALLDSEVAGAVNVASGEPVELRQIARTIGESVGRPELVQLGALPPRAGEPERIVADTRRLRAEVGWRPEFTLEEGLRDVIGWWKGQEAP